MTVIVCVEGTSSYRPAIVIFLTALKAMNKTPYTKGKAMKLVDVMGPM